MKKINILFLVLITLSCTNTENKEQRISAVKEEMTEFFGNTPMENFGRKDNQAIKWLMEGMTQYNFSYILDVDREKLKKINSKCKDVLQSYVFDYKKMGNKFVMPKDWPQPEFFNPYALMAITDFRNDHSSYWQKEVQSSEKPFFKEVSEIRRLIGAYAFVSPIKGIISNHIDENMNSVSDKDVFVFITFCFWEYLCYCANIHVVSGRDKTEYIMKNTMFKPS